MLATDPKFRAKLKKRSLQEEAKLLDDYDLNLADLNQKLQTSVETAPTY